MAGKAWKATQRAALKRARQERTTMTNEAKKTIAERLEEITKKNRGRLTPEAVVQDAEDESSPLHSWFEWDDDRAAHRYRIEQARELIRSVKVEFHVDSRTVSTVRYVRDPSAQNAQGYVEVASLRDERELAVEAMEAELGRVSAALERALGIADVLGLRPQVEVLRKRVADFQKQMAAPPRAKPTPRSARKAA